MEIRIPAQVLQVRDSSGNRFTEKHDGHDVLRQEIQQAAAEMTLKQAIFFDPAQIDRQQLGPSKGGQYLGDRVLIAEKQAQGHARRLRKVHEKYTRALRSPENTIAHMTMHSRLTLCFQKFKLFVNDFRLPARPRSGPSGAPLYRAAASDATMIVMNFSPATTHSR